MTQQDFGAVRLELRRTEDGFGYGELVIDNRRKLNCLNSRLMREFVRTFESASTDDRFGAVVVRGAGNRAFVGGADISEMVSFGPADAREFIGLVHGCCEAVRASPKPVLAIMEGYCFGAGIELAAACDFRIAAGDAQFGMPEVRLGIPSVVEAALLPQLIGWGRTREILLLGELFSADQALQWGYVGEVVPAGELEAAAARLLGAISLNDARAVTLQKRLIRRWEDLRTSDAVSAGIDAFAEAWESPIPSARMREFLKSRAEKRPIGQAEAGGPK